MKVFADAKAMVCGIHAMAAAERSCGQTRSLALKADGTVWDWIGGRYWDRTSDPCRVKAVLYR